MADTLEVAVAERLAADEDLVDRLAQHEHAPAVFSDIHVPAGVGFPMIAVIARPGTSDGSKTQTGYEQRVLVRIFGGLKQQTEVTEIAAMVRALNHHNPIDVGEWEGWLAVADAPAPVPVVNAFCLEVGVRFRFAA